MTLAELTAAEQSARDRVDEAWPVVERIHPTRFIHHEDYVAALAAYEQAAKDWTPVADALWEANMARLDEESRRKQAEYEAWTENHPDPDSLTGAHDDRKTFPEQYYIDPEL